MILLVQDTTSAFESLSGFLPLLLIGAVFFFFIIRPQRKRSAERDAMLKTVSVGSEVVTIGGIFGEVEALDDNWADVLVGEDVILRISRGSISRIVTPDDEESLEAFASGASLDGAPEDFPVDPGADAGHDDGVEDTWGEASDDGTSSGDGHRTGT